MKIARLLTNGARDPPIRPITATRSPVFAVVRASITPIAPVGCSVTSKFAGRAVDPALCATGFAAVGAGLSQATVNEKTMMATIVTMCLDEKYCMVFL